LTPTSLEVENICSFTDCSTFSSFTLILNGIQTPSYFRSSLDSENLNFQLLENEVNLVAEKLLSFNSITPALNLSQFSSISI
jgi:hypothetical protein